MAAITPTTYTGGAQLIRNASAQATTGQIDWLYRPSWAKYMLVYLDITANAGTTPTTIPGIVTVANPSALTDASQVGPITLSQGSTITTASSHYYQVGPGVSGIANAGDAAAADGWHSFNMALPAIIGINILNDRTTGDETYTYTLYVEFRP